MHSLFGAQIHVSAFVEPDGKLQVLISRKATYYLMHTVYPMLDTYLACKAQYA